MTRTLEILDRMGANTPESTNGPRVTGTYDVYFGLGHTFRLIDSPSVFKVSAAGLSLGYYLLRHLQRSEIHGRVLDMGTGSGVLALLLRDMGAQDIVASDVPLPRLQLRPPMNNSHSVTRAYDIFTVISSHPWTKTIRRYST